MGELNAQNWPFKWFSRRGCKRVILDSEKWNFPVFLVLGSVDGGEGRKSGSLENKHFCHHVM